MPRFMGRGRNKVHVETTAAPAAHYEVKAVATYTNQLTREERVRYMAAIRLQAKFRAKQAQREYCAELLDRATALAPSVGPSFTSR